MAQQPHPQSEINVQKWLDGSADTELLHHSLDSVGGPLRVDSGGLGGKDEFWQQAFPVRSRITPLSLHPSLAVQS